MSLWNLFLQCIYRGISTIIRIRVKPEIHSYRYSHLYENISTVTPIHTKPEISKSWISSYSQLQPYMKYLHKLIAYYIIEYNHYNSINNIRKQVIGYIMSMKRKRRSNLKARNPKQDKYHLMFNNVLPSDSDLLCTNTHKGCCLLNINEYNCKLRSVIGLEDESKVTKWTWYNKQVRDTLLCSWMVSRKLVDGTNIGRSIGRLLDLVYAPSSGMRNSVGSTTSFFHTSMVVHPGSNDHLRIRKFIHEGLLSSLSKKHQSGKVSMDNAALGFDYKLSINMLMKQLYIAVRYFYVLNRITLEDDCHVVYAPSADTKK